MAFKKFKNDKVFRRNVLIAIVVFVFLTNLNTTPQTQATQAICNSYNSGSGGPYGFGSVDSESLNGCIAAGCYPAITNAMKESFDVWGVPLIGPIVECTNQIFGSIQLPFTCLAEVPTGDYVAGDVSTQQACESEYGFSASSFCSIPLKKCAVNPNPTTTCPSWTEPFTQLYRIVDNSPSIDCKTQAYLVMGVGVVVFLAVL